VGVGVEVPIAEEVVGELWKVEVVGVIPLEVKCPGVALGLGLGEVGGWVDLSHSAQASGHPQSCTAGGCH
jgi:hypothetical protein